MAIYKTNWFTLHMDIHKIYTCTWCTELTRAKLNSMGKWNASIHRSMLSYCAFIPHAKLLCFIRLYRNLWLHAVVFFLFTLWPWNDMVTEVKLLKCKTWGFEVRALALNYVTVVRKCMNTLTVWFTSFPMPVLAL